MTYNHACLCCSRETVNESATAPAFCIECDSESFVTMTTEQVKRAAWAAVCRLAAEASDAAHIRVFAAAVRCGMDAIAGRLAERAAIKARDAVYAANRRFASPASIINREVTP